jgi:hypothetical protein
LISIFRCWGSSRDKVWEGSRSSLAGNLSDFCFTTTEEVTLSEIILISDHYQGFSNSSWYFLRISPP